MKKFPVNISDVLKLFMVLVDKVLVPMFQSWKRKSIDLHKKKKKNELNNNKVCQFNADENITINGKCLLFQNKRVHFN